MKRIILSLIVIASYALALTAQDNRCVVRLKDGTEVEYSVSEIDNIFWRVDDGKVWYITLDQTLLTMLEGESYTLVPTISPATAKNKDVTWSSSDPDVAYVSKAGKVVAVGLGEATVTCTAQDGSGAVATCKVQVLDHYLRHYEDWTSTNKGEEESTSSHTYRVEGKAGHMLSFDWMVSTSKEGEMYVSINDSTVLAQNVYMSGTYKYFFPSDGTYTVVVRYSKCAHANEGDDIVTIRNFRVEDVEDPFLGDGTTDGNEWIDLGLPSGTLWAKYNVGATPTEYYGCYYAWGETKPKSSYVKENYTTLAYIDAAHDAAAANWGNAWCMPNNEQFEELMSNSYTTWNWTVYNGVRGVIITSRTNGKSIFLPGAGYVKDGSTPTRIGDWCGYWTKETIISSWYTTMADQYQITGVYRQLYPVDKYRGCSVRPVRCVAASSIDIEGSDTYLTVGKKLRLEATVSPANASYKSVAWSTSDESIATVSSYGWYLAWGETEPKDTYDCGFVTALSPGTVDIIATSLDSGKVSAKYTIKVLADHDYADLGLPSGTLWATCNVGADSSEQCGDYFAWGETEPKSEYTEGNYVFAGDTMDAGHDAATVNWGKDWCMPTLAQWQELMDERYTEITGTMMEGTYVQKIVSRANGAYIILPAAGYRCDSRTEDVNSFGYYWSSESISSGYAFYYTFDSNYPDTNSSNAYFGQSVRPVRVKPGGEQ